MVVCNKPFVHKGNAYGCGHCVPCRLKKRREWTHRMMLEAAEHGDNCFATLTYAEEKLPEDLSVRPETLSVFIRSLRDKGNKFRFFGVGEYGDLSGRPHYHVALFGFPSCSNGITRKGMPCCRQCEEVRRSWGNGQILLGTLEPKSMAYVAGYLKKKMTRDSDPRLEGRLPEFARMSKHPGIGYGMMHELASTLMEMGLDETLVDVPVTLQHGKRVYPLGRYLRRSLRALIGRSKNAPEQALAQYGAEMQAVRDFAFANSISIAEVVKSLTEGRRIQIEAKVKREKNR